MSRPSSITVSRSKRGTTVKATGKAAQALFDAMAERMDAEISPCRPGPHTIHFEDHGQDFLEWDIDANGVVTDSRPFQASTWSGSVLINDAAPGGLVAYLSKYTNQRHTIRYPIVKVVMRRELSTAASAEGAPTPP